MYLYANETGGINVQSVDCKPAVLALYVREWCGVVRAAERRTAVFTASIKNKTGSFSELGSSTSGIEHTS